MGNETLISEGGTGLTSCLSVRLHNAINYHAKYGKYPIEIDSSKQFMHYKDEDGQNVSEYLMGEYIVNQSLPLVGYNHGWQYGWVDQLFLDSLSPLAKMICNPSVLVLKKASEMKDRMEGRTAVLYRGNDKGLEIVRTPYTAMEEMAKASGSERFLVQTDEEEFYQYFLERFPDTICFNEIPRINKNPDSYVMPELGKRVDFAVNFLAALISIAHSEKLIMNTGNTGLWAALYRGSKEGIYQWHGNEGRWRNF